ncbi:CatB-related O-acetyltransferase [Aureibaculum sp. A20]|uniref:CatB-related O-acetyltransferase n=1 Tax=Aureibaculum flavum TaxID=2795986 RepID=A0ABS0WKX6_9FLAO|nr:CatB-related O-acetyltransferase [Aureibaculum flavum]
MTNSKIGNHSYVNSKTSVNRTSIGKFCSIGSNVVFGLGKHPTTIISTHPAFYSNNKSFKTFADKVYFKEYENIKIGNDVWIGYNSIIMDGVNIGNGAIIAAGAVVTKDVKPYEVVGGVPARHIKYRFTHDMINLIEKTEWWNNDEDFFKDNYKIFLDNEKFINYFKNRN